MRRIDGLIEDRQEYILAKKLSQKERKDFGLPKEKKYPMPDKEHVYKAIQMFKYAKPSERKTLARNIKKYIRKYNMDINVSKDSAFGKYYYG